MSDSCADDAPSFDDAKESARRLVAQFEIEKRRADLAGNVMVALLGNSYFVEDLIDEAKCEGESSFQEKVRRVVPSFSLRLADTLLRELAQPRMKIGDKHPTVTFMDGTESEVPNE